MALIKIEESRGSADILVCRVGSRGAADLLVCEVGYHAASKNCQFAFVVTQDTDFCYALRRVEDFGCRTAVIAVGAEAPDRLRDSSDYYIHVPKELLIKKGFARAA